MRTVNRSGRSPTRCAAALAAAAFGVVAGLSGSVFGQQTSRQAVFVSGTPVPDGNGNFADFAADPVLNGAGRVVVRAILGDTSGGSTDDSGYYLFDGAALVKVAREGQAAPDGNGKFRTFYSPTLNDPGQMAFLGDFSGTSGGAADDKAIIRRVGTTLTQFARRGPDVGIGTSFFPALNDAGELAFHAAPRIVRTQSGQLVEIAREGQAAPGGAGNFDEFASPTFNNLGQAAFYAKLEVPGSTNVLYGMFRGDGQTVNVIARQNQTVPDGNGRFDLSAPISGASEYRAALNDAGQAAFHANLSNTSGGTSDNEGIFVGNGTTLTQVIRAGQTTPDGTGVFSSFLDPAINNVGQTAFGARLISPGNANGIYRATGSTLLEIARTGRPVPGGNGVFANVSGFLPGINNVGQVAFTSTLSGTGGGASDDGGLFLFDDKLGLLTVAREGQAFLGSIVTEVGFSGGGPYGEDRSGLNESGQTAYRFTLSDGRIGIAIATSPEVADLTPGDSDFDNDVDLNDLGTLATNFGKSNGIFGWINGDFDNDNDVDLNDLGSLASNYDRGAQRAFADFQSLTAVPEPALGVMWLAFAAAVRRRPRADG